MAGPVPAISSGTVPRRMAGTVAGHDEEQRVVALGRWYYHEEKGRSHQDHGAERKYGASRGPGSRSARSAKIKPAPVTFVTPSCFFVLKCLYRHPRRRSPFRPQYVLRLRMVGTLAPPVSIVACVQPQSPQSERGSRREDSLCASRGARRARSVRSTNQGPQGHQKPSSACSAPPAASGTGTARLSSTVWRRQAAEDNPRLPGGIRVGAAEPKPGRPSQL